MPWARDGQQTVGAQHHSVQPRAMPSSGWRCTPSSGSRPHSVPWPPRLVHTTAQTPRPLWWLSKTWHPSNTQGPLPALILERPIHLKPEHLRGAAPPYSFAWPVFSTQLVLKAAPWLGNLPPPVPPGVFLGPRYRGSLLEKQNLRPYP